MKQLLSFLLILQVLCFITEPAIGQQNDKEDPMALFEPISGKFHTRHILYSQVGNDPIR